VSDLVHTIYLTMIALFLRFILFDIL